MALRRGQLDDMFGVWDLAPSVAPTRTLSLDYETYCDIDLKKFGLDLYSAHPSCEVLMCAYSLDGGRIKHWDATNGPMPRDLRRALEDPDVLLWAFNAQFEWVITLRVLRIASPVTNWRCTMVLAYMQSFVGTLDQIGRYSRKLDKNGDVTEDIKDKLIAIGEKVKAKGWTTRRWPIQTFPTLLAHSDPSPPRR